MARKSLLLITFLGFIGLNCTDPSFQTASQDAPSRPNIIFIMSDDHAEQAISAYGSNLIETPNLDRIAQEGIRFDNAFVTNSICAPSRAVLLTGKYSHLNGLRDNLDEFDGSQATFPKMLQAAGYQTAIVGKWHLKTEPTGFDYWKILIGQGEYYNPVFVEMGDRSAEEGYVTDLITDSAIEFLKNRDRGRPFTLLYHHKAPHRNWMPDTKHLDLFKDREFPLPENFFDDYQGRVAASEQDMRIADMYLGQDMKLQKEFYGQETGTGGNRNADGEQGWVNSYSRLTEEQKKAWDAHYGPVNEEYSRLRLQGNELVVWKYQRYLRDYLRCIHSVDLNVGRLLDYLDEEGLSENTIVIYTSDQGFYLGEHGWYDKRFIYEESLGMPLMIRYPPEIAAGSVSKELVMNLDFAPTLLDYAGVEIPSDFQGASLRQLASGTPPDNWRDSIYYHYYEYPHGWHEVKRHYGIRTDRFKLIHFYNDIDTWELFDLKEDPSEMENVYENDDYSDIRKELHERLEALRKNYGDLSE